MHVVYYIHHREKTGIIVSNRCYYLTPRSWNTFFTTCIRPEFLLEFNCSHCYWLPGNQLCENIVKMVNIQELAIKGTQLLLSHLIRIFQNCQQITDLDFSFHHEGATTEPSVFENQLHDQSVVTEALEKLIRLNISTSVTDAINYYNDPWVLIIKILRYINTSSESVCFSHLISLFSFTAGARTATIWK